MSDLELLLEAERVTDNTAWIALVRELRTLLRRELAVPVAIHSKPRTDGEQQELTRSDPVAVAAMILSIPSAALALHDLAARTHLKDCLRRVLARARELRAQARWRSSADHIALPDRSAEVSSLPDENDESAQLDALLANLARAQERR
jgi:hypothetical protein